MAINQTQSNLNYRSYVDQLRILYQKPIAQTSFALVLTLLTIIFFGLAAIRPTLGTVTRLVRELEELREIDKKITQKLAALSAAQDEYLAVQDQLDVLDQLIPDSQQLQQLLLELEYLAWSNQTNLTSLRIAELTTIPPDISNNTDSDEPFPSVQITLSSQGSYDQLKQLLEKISNHNRYLTIDSVAFIQPEDTIGLSQEFIKMSVKLTAFWSPPSNNQPIAQNLP